MKAALAWVMASRTRAAALTTVFAALPFTGILAAALIALVVLRRGLAEGGLVAAIAAGAIALLYSAAGIGLQPLAVTVLITWAPVVALAMVLRVSSSQARVLALTAVLGCAAVAGIFAAAGDPAAVWEQMFREQFLPLLDQAGLPYDKPRVLEALPGMAAMMTGLVAAFWAAGHFVTIALARWAQAALYNPGGFAGEFQALRLGGTVVVAAGAVFIASTLTNLPIAVNLALVFVVTYAVQGVAVMHGVVANAGLHWGWLVPPYVLATVLPPHTLALFAMLGFSDYWVDFRRRFAAR